jgi:hypothetical protein
MVDDMALGFCALRMGRCTKGDGQKECVVDTEYCNDRTVKCTWASGLEVSRMAQEDWNQPMATSFKVSESSCCFVFVSRFQCRNIRENIAVRTEQFTI